jgi:hexosaminidase
MVETVLGEVAELFPGPYIHIGGDEADKSDWQECSRCRQVMKENNLANVDELHRHFVRRLNAVVTGLGRTMIGWDDILEGGRTQASTVTVWRGDDNVSAALRGGHNVIVTPPEFYFDYYQSTSVDEPLAIHGITTLRDSYEFELVPGAVPDSARRQVLGAQGTLWTEYVTTESHAEYMCLPRMCALAEQVWSNPERKSWASFIARLRPHFQRFDVLGVNASRSVYNVYTHYAVQTDRSLRVSLHCDGDNHAIRYTLDGSAPGPGSAEFGTDLLLDQSTCIRACAQDRSSQALFGDTRLQFEHHKAIGCPVTFAHPPEQIWPGDPERVVVDGVLASLGFFLHRDWAGFAGQDLDAVIDLQMPMYIGEAGVGFDVAYHRRLYPPTGIEVELSNDGSKWVSVARLDDSDIDAERGRVVASFPDQEARYVRVRARNEQQVFSHECAGPAPVSLYVDEIVIR